MTELYYVMKELDTDQQGGLARSYPDEQAAIDVAKTQASEKPGVNFLVLGVRKIVGLPKQSKPEPTVKEVAHAAPKV